LHSDIRRLVALVLPVFDHRARETIACDYFIDALADPDFSLKVRERSPAYLDSALRIALQLEVWTKDVDSIRNEQPKHFVRKSPEVTQTDSLIKTNEELRKQVTELQNQLAQETTSRCRKKWIENETSTKEFLHVKVVAVQIIQFGCVRIKRQKREDIPVTIRAKFGMSGKSEFEIAQVGTRNAEVEIDTVMPTA